MKLMRYLLAVCVVISLAGVVVAEDAVEAAKDMAPAVTGKLLEINGAELVIEVEEGEDDKQVTVATDKNTKVKVDGRDATMDDLEVGMHIVVPAYEETAVMILARKDKEKGESNGNEAKGKESKGDNGKGKNKDRGESEE